MGTRTTKQLEMRPWAHSPKSLCLGSEQNSTGEKQELLSKQPINSDLNQACPNTCVFFLMHFLLRFLLNQYFTLLSWITSAFPSSFPILENKFTSATFVKYVFYQKIHRGEVESESHFALLCLVNTPFFNRVSHQGWNVFLLNTSQGWYLPHGWQMVTFIHLIENLCLLIGTAAFKIHPAIRWIDMPTWGIFQLILISEYTV